jgi:predicted MPP superfamily phosphohydrolase
MQSADSISLHNILSSPSSEEMFRDLPDASEPFQGLSLPRVDFAALLAEQVEAAQNLKRRYIDPPTLRQRMASLLEGPWAPEAHDLPIRQESFDPSARLSFREEPRDLHVASARRMVKERICRSERVWSLTQWTSVYEYEVPIAQLPQPLHGLTILHLSDIHFLRSSDRPWKEMSRVADFLEKGESHIDLILLSGDVITKNPDDLCAQSLRQLNRLSTVCPQAFMVHGNHDYHGHVPAIISKQLEQVGFHDINNHHIRLNIGGAPLNIYGIDDAYFGKPTPPSAISTQETNIVLTHNLDAIRGDFPKGVDLILSGHTHWGELKLFDGVRVMNWWGYSDNLNRHTKHWEMLTDRTRSYVHPGLARYYVPFRGIRHPPGIAIHKLVPDLRG